MHRFEIQPPRWKRIAFRKRLRRWYSHAICSIRSIRAFTDSAAASVLRSITAFGIPHSPTTSRWVLAIRVARTIESSLLRDVIASHASHAFRAQPMLA
jgi:hypothetical protein